MSFFDPFVGIIETRVSPHAHVLRTSFFQKCGLAFRVYAGWFFESQEGPHIGIFDIVTGFIPLGLFYLASKAWGSKNLFLNVVVFPLLFLVNVPLVLTRLLFGLAFALVTSILVIPIVHPVAWYIKGRELIRNAGKLKVINGGGQVEFLDDVLQRTGKDIADLRVEERITQTIISPSKYELCSIESLNNDPRKAIEGKIYLSKNGDYCVRKGEQIINGSLAKLLKKDGALPELNDKSFKIFVVRTLVGRDQLEMEKMPCVCFQFGRASQNYMSLLFPLDQSAIDSIPLADKPAFQEQVSALKSLLLLNPDQITKRLEESDPLDSDDTCYKVHNLYMPA